MLWVGLFVLALPAGVSAETVLRTADDVAITTDQAVAGDFYGAGNTVTISGSVAGDALVAGGQVRHNGTTSADLHAAGGMVSVHGLVGDDVRITAGEAVVEGDIAGDLVFLGGSLEILSSARIDGDVLVFAGQVDVRGTVGREVLGFADIMRIDGDVGSDVAVTVGSLTLGDRASVTGAVRYVSEQELTRSQGATVAGEIEKSDPLMRGGLDSRYLMVPLLILLFSALSFFLLMRRQLQAVASAASAHPARNALIGFAVFFLVPAVILILTVSVLGSLLGIVLLFGYSLFVCASAIAAGAVLGGYVARLLGFSDMLTAVSVTLGTIIFYALFFVPFLGPILGFSLFAITLGSFAEVCYRASR